MFTFRSMPRKVKSFFTRHQAAFSRPVFGHFWRLVLAICITHGATIDRLVRAMRSPCHRTKHGEFLWKSRWHPSETRHPEQSEGSPPPQTGDPSLHSG